jgi:hypothetical protein
MGVVPCRMTRSLNTPTTSDATCIIEGGDFFLKPKKGAWAGSNGLQHMESEAAARNMCMHSTLQSKAADPGIVHVQYPNPPSQATWAGAHRARSHRPPSHSALHCPHSLPCIHLGSHQMLQTKAGSQFKALIRVLRVGLKFKITIQKLVIT